MLDIPEKVKTLYQTDSIKKNFRVHFPSGEMDDITNDNVVSESVKFTESLCSQDTFKFGLTEASEIDFETVDIGNMLGMTIECYSEICVDSIDYSDLTVVEYNGGHYYAVSYGSFVVSSCPRSHDNMRHRQVTAYSQRKNELVEANKKMIDYPSTYKDLTIDIASFIAVQFGSLLPLNGYYSHSAWMAQASDYDTLTCSDVNGKEICTFSDGDITYTYTFDPDFYIIIYLKAAIWTYDLGVETGVGNTLDIEYVADSLADGIIEAYSITDGHKDAIVSGIIGTLESCALFNGKFPTFGITEYSTTSSDIESKELSIRLYDNEPYYFYPASLLESVMSYTVTNLRFYIIESKTENKTTKSKQAQVKTDINDKGDISSIRHDNYFRFDPSSDGGDMDRVLITIPSTLKAGKKYRHTNGISFEDLINGWLELNGILSRRTRDGTDALITLSQLNPQAVPPNTYESVWWDEYSVEPIGTVKFAFNDGDEDQVEEYTIGNGASVYDLTDNYVLNNARDASESYCKELIDRYFVPHLSETDSAGNTINILSYTPIELDMMGLPYLEDGDFVIVQTPDGTKIKTYIMNHVISGIQSLSDSITSSGGEITEYVEEGE